MKTKKKTKTRKDAKKVKEAIKAGLFFAVPIFLFIYVLSSNNSFNMF